MSDQPKPSSTPRNDAAHVPEPFLITLDDLFDTPPAPRPAPSSPQPDAPAANSPAQQQRRRPAISLPAAVTRDDSEGGVPKVWATVNVDRLLAFSERYQPELLAPAALKSWFATLASQPLLACYKERGSRQAILALGFSSGNRADPFFDLPGDPIPVSLAPTAATTQVRRKAKRSDGTFGAEAKAATTPHMRMRFESESDIWIRSRREIVLVAPASPTESLRACRLFVEFGSLDATGHMTYTFRPATYEVITPDQAHERPMVQIRRAA